MADLPIRQDRIALAILLGIEFIGVPMMRKTLPHWPCSAAWTICCAPILLPYDPRLAEISA